MAEPISGAPELIGAPELTGAPQVICLGEALVDRLGPPGGDPATAAPEQRDDRLGGAPANVACGLARLGTPVAFAGRLGCDAIGATFVRLLEQRGVELSALQRDPERPTRIVLVRRDAAGDRRFGGFAGDRGQGYADQALAAEPLEHALAPLLAGARWLQIGSIPLASPSSARALGRAVELARIHAVAVALDVNWRPTFWDPAADPASGPTAAQIAAMEPLLQQAALLKCAAEEARWLFGSADPVAVSAALPQRPGVVVSDGGAPLRWCLQGRSGEQPAFPVPVVDTTGAGDAFMAGLLHGLCGPPQPVEALLRFAAACGALVCQGAGAIDPQPGAAEVRAFLAAREGMACPPGLS